METVYAAVDLGGTKISAALGTASEGLLVTETIPTPPDANPEAVLAEIARLVLTLSESAAVRPEALGVSVPGLVDTRSGRVHFAPFLPAPWLGVPAGAFLEHSLRMPVRVVNDAQCTALAELLYGHGRDYRSFVLFTLGNRIGGALVIDGRLRVGPSSAAGELGHLIVTADGPLCVCGNKGCLEAFASAPAIARFAGFPDIESAAIAARDGDPRAKAAFGEAANYLGIATANLVTALHPDAVLFGGAMSDFVDLLLMPARAAVNAHVRMFEAESVSIRRTGTGPDALLLGALALNAAPDTLAL